MKHKTTRRTYRLRNWREYNAALIERGSLTLWVSQDILAGWHEAGRTGKPGAPRTYRDTVITGMAMLSAVYRMTLRATQGLLIFVLKTAERHVASARLHDLMPTAPNTRGEIAAASISWATSPGRGCHWHQGVWRRRMESAQALDSKRRT